MPMMEQLLKKLDAIFQLLLEEREERKAEKAEKERLENEKRSIEIARDKNRQLPTGGIHSSREMEDTSIKSGGELIPFGLSESEKELLRSYYND